MYADENVIKIKHAVLREVAKLAFEGTLDAERDHIAVRLIPARHHSSVVVSTKKEKLSASVSVLQRAKPRDWRIMET